MSGGEWPPTKLQAAGLIEGGHCRACGEPNGDAKHRHAGCPHTRAFLPNWKRLYQLHDQQLGSDLFWARGLIPRMLPLMGRPMLEDNEVWEVRTSTGTVRGLCFADGSGIDATIPDACRTGFAFACFAGGRDSGNAEPVGLCRGVVPLPQALQNSLHAEVCAVLKTATSSERPLDLVLDCLDNKQDLDRGRVWCCRASNPVAHYWAIIWAALDDGGFSCSWIPSYATKANVQSGALSQLGADRSKVVDETAKRGRDAHAVPRATIAKAKIIMESVRQVLTVTAKAGVGRLSGAVPTDVPELDQRAHRSKRERQAPPPPLHAHVPERCAGGRRCLLCNVKRVGVRLIHRGRVPGS